MKILLFMLLLNTGTTVLAQKDSNKAYILYDDAGRLLADSTLRLSQDGLRLWNQAYKDLIQVIKTSFQNHPLLVEAGKEFKLMFELTLGKEIPFNYSIYKSSIDLREDEIHVLLETNKKMFTLLENILKNYSINQTAKFYIPIRLILPDNIFDPHVRYAPLADSIYIENGWIISCAGMVTIIERR